MSHSTRPTYDDDFCIMLKLPSGNHLKLTQDDMPEDVKHYLIQNKPEYDVKGILAMIKFTGLTATLKRYSQTTINIEDVDK